MNKFIIGAVALLLAGGGGVWYWFSNPTVDPVVQSVAPAETSQTAVKIIAFGDSLTAGLGVTQGEAYPAQLETMLNATGYDVVVINAGVSGETTRGNLERANFIKSQNADIVILGIGGNDALRQLPVSETEKNIRATLAVLESGTTPPVITLLQMQAPLNAGIQYKRDFDAIYSAVAREKQLVLIPFLTPELFLDTNNKLPDGIHYNALGYNKVVTAHIAPAISKLLDTAGP